MFVALSRCVVHTHSVRQACATDMCSQKHRASPCTMFFQGEGLTGSRLTQRCLPVDGCVRSNPLPGCALYSNVPTHCLPVRTDSRHIHADRQKAALLAATQADSLVHYGCRQGPTHGIMCTGRVQSSRSFGSARTTIVSACCSHLVKLKEGNWRRAPRKATMFARRIRAHSLLYCSASVCRADAPGSGRTHESSISFHVYLRGLSKRQAQIIQHRHPRAWAIDDSNGGAADERCCSRMRRSCSYAAPVHLRPRRRRCESCGYTVACEWRRRRKAPKGEH